MANTTTVELHLLTPLLQYEFDSSVCVLHYCVAMVICSQLAIFIVQGLILPVLG